jgi:lipopolysaccharide/colanic/teichoic acid biosynthesis glycosyltransferase
MNSRLNKFQEVLKRGFDLIFSSFALIVLSPMFLFISLGIVISDGLPVFYISKRCGKNEKTFSMIKFRSMVKSSNDSFLGYTNKDSSITKFGFFLRKSKLDEMPQFFNVFLGQMSVVGPRPMPIRTVNETYYGLYKVILSIKPGMVSPGSLFDYKHGDLFVTNEQEYKTTVLPVKIELEKQYAENHPFYTDIVCIFDTVKIIVSIMFGKKTFSLTDKEMEAMKKKEMNKKD